MLSLFLYSTANPNWISHSHTLLLNSRWLNSLCWQFQLLCFWHCGRACNFYSLTVESLCFFVWWSLSILWSWLFHIVFPLLPSPQPHFLFRSHPWQQPKTYQVPRQVNITPPLPYSASRCSANAEWQRGARPQTMPHSASHPACPQKSLSCMAALSARCIK